MYKSATESLRSQKGPKERSRSLDNLTFAERNKCAAYAGFFSTLIANPFDVVLVRMQADPRLP